jgi:alcohol dehydrogenase, propanol-preferring
MKALRLVAWKKPPRLQDVDVPEPGPGQVVLRMAAAGACHSDLHLMEWSEGMLPWKLPFTLGHENAGFVHALGAGVDGIKKGDAMLVYGSWGCGHCARCRLGRENYCLNAASIPAMGGGLGRDGGMAEYMLVPSTRLLVPIGKLDPVQAAPLADAALTPYHAIKPSLARLVPGSSAVVIGVGGLGQMAVQLLKGLTGTYVAALDKDPRRLTEARELGADEVINIGATSEAEIVRVAGGADLVLDVVGSDETLALGSKLLRSEGRLVLIGLALGNLPFNFFAIPYGAELATSYWGTVTELMELVALAEAGRIKVHTETFPLDRALDAYQRLREGGIKGRAVIVPR